MSLRIVTRLNVPLETPSRKPNRFNPKIVRGVTLHWIGATALAHAPDDIDKLRKRWAGIQRYHIHTKGWFDIAYNFGVGLGGHIFEGRGWEYQSGANGKSKFIKNTNSKYMAILLLNGMEDTPTPAQISAVQALVRQARVYFPDADEIRPHSYLKGGGTACPGNAVRSLIKAGEFEPAPLPVTPPPAGVPEHNGQVDLTGAQVVDLLRKVRKGLNDLADDLNHV